MRTVRTSPPCMDDVTMEDCPRRYVGCRAECEKWHEWLAIHAAELEKEKDNRNKQRDISGFFIDQGKRTRADNMRKYQQKKNGTRREVKA